MPGPLPETPSAYHPLEDPVYSRPRRSLSPNDPAWNTWMAVGAWIASVLLIATVPALFLAPYALTRMDVQGGTEELMAAMMADSVAIALQVLGIIPAHLLTLVIAWFIVTAGRTRSFFESLGWQAGGVRWFHYLGIMLGFLALGGLLGQFVPEQENEMLRILKSSRTAVFLVAFMATFTAPLVEEVIYRGLLFSAIQKRLGSAPAIGIVTLLFSLVHLPQYYPSVSTMLLLTLLSFVLTVMRAKSNNLLPCVILHTVFNAFQSGLLIAEPWIATPAEPQVPTATAFFTLLQ